MRAREFISEEKSKTPLRKSFKQASPNTVAYSHLDNNNHPYMAYRFGIALAVSPNEDMAAKGPIGSEFAIVDYTDGDAEIRKGAEKILGVKSKSLTGKGSKELDSTDTKSPVADWQNSPQNKIKESASAGATGSGSVASAPATGGGWLFGGTVGAPKGKKKKAKVIKRS